MISGTVPVPGMGAATQREASPATKGIPGTDLVKDSVPGPSVAWDESTVSATTPADRSAQHNSNQ